MSTYEDSLLVARFAALAPEPLPGDWSDVLGRAGTASKRGQRLGLIRSGHGRRARPVVVLAAAALVLAMATASAFAVRALLAETGLVGLAPVGATPSAPEKGELVLEFAFGRTPGDPGRFNVTVYADGRMISERVGDYPPTDEHRESTGLLERRLTPEGVELVKAAVISTGLVDRDLWLYGANYRGNGLYDGFIDFRDGDRRVHVTWGNAGGAREDVSQEAETPEQAAALLELDERLEDPVSWLPASAWERAEARPFVPWGYTACYGGAMGVQELSQVLDLLPSRAADMLGSRDRRRNTRSPDFVYWCSDFTNEEARVLSRIFDDAGMRGHEDVFGLTYGPYGREPGVGEFLLSFTPLFPDEAEGGGIR